MSRRTTDAGPASNTSGPKAILGRSNDARSVFSDRVRSNFAESASKSFSFSAEPRSTAQPGSTPRKRKRFALTALNDSPSCWMCWYSAVVRKSRRPTRPRKRPPAAFARLLDRWPT